MPSSLKVPSTIDVCYVPATLMITERVTIFETAQRLKAIFAHC